MAKNILEALVLRGSALLGDLAAVAHSGTSAVAVGQTPGTANSMRHPTTGYRPELQGVDPDGVNNPSGVTPGAGRSRRQSSFSAFTRCARTSRHGTPWWPGTKGGTATAAVAKRPARTAGGATPAGEADAFRLAGLLRGSQGL